MSTDTKGKTRAIYFGTVVPMVSHTTQPDWDFLYNTSLVIDPRFWVGDKVELPDGREFHYAKSTKAITTNLACNFTAAGYTSSTAFVVAAAIGDKKVTIPAATHAALTQNELRGGYVVMGIQGGTTTVQVRGIVGNTASLANAAFDVYLDAALSSAITSSVSVETYQNPFAAISQDNTELLPRAGMAATNVSAADTYFWVETKGATWCSPQTGVGADDGGVTAMWRHDGSLMPLEGSLGATMAAYAVAQIAGVCLEGSAAGNGPLLMLQ